MKKIINLLFVIMLLCGTVAISADISSSERMVRSTNFSISMFNNISSQFNLMLTKIFDEQHSSSVSYQLIRTKFGYSNLEKGTYEIEYTKLKDICTPVPADLKKVPAGACAKLLIDTNGFKNPPNKLFSDTKVLSGKDQFVLYMYANGVKPLYNSPEDLILYSR